LKSPENSESITKVSKTGGVMDKVSEEVVVYSEEALLLSGDDDSKGLYEEFKNQVLTLDDKIEVAPRKHYIAFRMRGSNFLDVLIQKKKLKFYLNLKKGELNDPYKLGKDCSEKGRL
jgi:predicted transport protein